MPIANTDTRPLAANLRQQRPVYWFDIGDLLNFLLSGDSPTGIQRIMLEILTKLETITDAEHYIRFCRNDGPGGRLVQVLPETVLGSQLRPPPKGLAWLWQLRTKWPLAAMCEPAPVEAGDVFVSLGLPWFTRNYNRRVSRLKSEHGVKFALLIHDLIPVTHPELVSRNVFNAFSNWIDGAIGNADLILTISDYSAKTLRDVAQHRGWRLPPIERLLFGAEPLRRLPRRIQRNPSVPPPDRYVLYVATFERRKNHQFLFNIWQYLCSKHGPASVPDLVLVGKRWGLIDKTFDENLRRSNGLNGKIRVFTEIDDDALRTFYEKCEFTIFPSLIEGWGLPVAESLSYGKLCIASNRTSIPEVAGNLVSYFDPDDFDETVRLLERVLFDPAWRARQERCIRSNFKPPSWSDCAQSLIEILDAQFANPLRFD